jgi:FAD/FMN-containing dehydrogenase
VKVPEDARQALAFALRRHLDGEVRFDPGSRHLYATDASNYRHVPAGVVLPNHLDDLLACLELCRQHDVPVTTRGAGTSLAGQATNVGVIIDTSRHLTRIHAIDPEARTARVEPGVVLGQLQRAAAPHGLRFGPDPSTAERCTLGGMIGNDACGPHTLVWGRTAHNVEELEIVTGDGVRMTVGRHDLDGAAAKAGTAGRVGEVFGGLLALREGTGDLVRARFPPLPRRVSGYHLDQLLHDDHLDVAKALVGTEGTCVTVVGATVRLVPIPATRALVLLGYPDLRTATAHVPAILTHAPSALEGIDDVQMRTCYKTGCRRPAAPPR